MSEQHLLTNFLQTVNREEVEEGGRVLLQCELYSGEYPEIPENGRMKKRISMKRLSDEKQAESSVTENTSRDPQAVLRCRLLLAFGKGASAGFVVWLILSAAGLLFPQTHAFSLQGFFLCTSWCGAFGYLLSLLKALLHL